MQNTRPILILGLAFSMAPRDVQAQFVVSGPGGSIGVQNPNGTYTYIYPQRLQSGANIAVPGSHQMTPYGNIWLGYDGQVHGNLVDPQTGDIHLRSAKTNRSTPVPQPRNYAFRSR